MAKKRAAATYLSAAATAAMLTLAACGNSDDGGSGDPDTYFDGEVITIIVPFGPGGGADTVARFLAPYLQDHIPGNPAIQVENVEGAGSIQGGNEFVLGREHDGHTLLMSGASTHTAHIFEDPAAEFDFGELTAVWGYQSGSVQYVRSETGITNAEELVSYDGTLPYGGVRPGGGELPRLLAFHLLEVPFDPVFGYDGAGAILAAFEQGEVDLNSDISSTFVANVTPLVEDGTAVPLTTAGTMVDGELTRDPLFPDLPHFAEVYEQVTGQPAEGTGWDAYRALLGSLNLLQGGLWMHGDAPEEAEAAVLAGVESMLEDSAFLAAAEEQLGGYDSFTGDLLAERVQVLTSVDPATLDYLRTFVRDEYGEEL